MAFTRTCGLRAQSQTLRVGIQCVIPRVSVWDLSGAYSEGLGSQTNRSVIAHQDDRAAAELLELLADLQHFLVSVSRPVARSGHKIHLDSRVRTKLGRTSGIAEPARQLRKQAPDAIGALRTPLVVFESVELFNDSKWNDKPNVRRANDRAPVHLIGRDELEQHIRIENCRQPARVPSFPKATLEVLLERLEPAGLTIDLSLNQCHRPDGLFVELANPPVTLGV